METIAIVRTYHGIEQAVENAFQFLQISLKSDLPIIIKPNLCCVRTPETGATTDPRVVEAIVNYIRKHHHAKEFYIVEADATELNADLAFQLLGYNKLARKLNVNIVNLTEIPFKCKKFPHNLNVTQIRVPQVFLKPHFLVSISKMKTHGLCHFTAILKNMFGCNPEPYKAKYHNKLNENIVDFGLAFRPHLSVVEAQVAMEGAGPTLGTPIKLDTLIFGVDPVATDHVTAKIMGINPNKVEYLRLAEKQGLGLVNCRISGNLEEIITKFKTTSATAKFFPKVRPLLKLSHGVYHRLFEFSH